jgi:c(7)-type cytochrome triheme protein
MRRLFLLGAIPGLALGVLLLGGAPSLGQVKVPPDFVMEKGEASPGPITFSHVKHKAKVAKCTTCHLKTFKMKRGQSGTITLAALQDGKFCATCHDGKKTIGGVVVFPIDECDKCHTP